MAERDHDHDSLTRVLRDAGCVAAEEEAGTLLTTAAGDTARLDELVTRRCRGEPLAWITGHLTFCGLRVRVAPGVYVPRSQTEPLARLAATFLPRGGVAVDLCTGSGAIAMVLRAAAPHATIVGTELDPVAAACARDNGVDVRVGDLDAALPIELSGRVDVVTAVTPYVPASALPFLPRDVVTFEPVTALDGGEHGTRVLDEVVRRSVRWLRPGGRLLLELGGDQAAGVGARMRAVGFTDLWTLTDDDGDVRGISGRLG